MTFESRLCYNLFCYGGLAQLVRAFASHARGLGFESLILHQKIPQTMLFRLRDFFVLFIGRLPGTEGAKPALQRRQRVKKASARVCGGEDGMV